MKVKNRWFLSLFVLSTLAVLLAAACGNNNHSKAKNSSGYKEPAVNSVFYKTTDPKITTAVEMRIADDDSLRNTDIQVQTEKAHVTLKGNVGTPEQKERAGLIAQNVEGVAAVTNAIQVSRQAAQNSSSSSTGSPRPGEVSIAETDRLKEKVDDAGITAEIKLRLARAEGLSAAKIDVDTKDGTVTLNGTVKSRAEEEKAVQVAQTVRNVRAVRSNLKLTTGTEQY